MSNQQHPLAAVSRRRDRLIGVITTSRLTTAWTGTDIGRITDLMLKVLPAKCQYGAVYQSLVGLTGKIPTQDEIKKLTHALAGDVQSLKNGKAVWPPVIPTTPAKVVVQFVAARRLPDRKFDNPTAGFRIRYRLRILKGRACPTDVDVVWSSKFVQFVAAKQDGLGFARPPRGDKFAKGRPYQHYDSLVGMLATVDVSINADGKTEVSPPRCGAGITAYNRQLTEMRWRNGFSCPFLFDHACHACPKGQQSCPAACRPLDLVTKLCPGCQKEAAFDPYWPSQVCKRCDSSGKKISLPVVPKEGVQ